MVARKFFSGSRRVNTLIFQVERHIDTNAERSQGGFILVSKPFANPDPSFPCDLDFVFTGGGPAEPMQKAIESTAGSAVAVDLLAKQMRTSEFYLWVDSLVP